MSTSIPDVVPRPRAGDALSGFAFLKARLHPGAFFRLWPGAPLADAVAMTHEKVVDLIQAFYPLNHQQGSKKSHDFEGFNQWQDEFPLYSGYSFRYYTVTHESLLEIIGWPQGFPDDSPIITPYLIGLSLDIVPLPAPSATSAAAGDVAKIEEEKEESEENTAPYKLSKKRPLSPSSSQPRAKRREYCCRCSSGTCDKCRCAKGRCDSSCQSSSCHFNSGVGAGAVRGASDDEDQMTED